MVVGGGPDYTRLPFFDGSRDVNAEVPYLSTAIAAHPFQDLDVELPSGVHLHWTLPAALRDGAHDAAGVDFPAVPNRWLVTRTDGAGESRGWVVESDYLHPEGNVSRPDLVTFPVSPDPAAGRHQPFRYVGRVLPLEEWREADVAAEYLDRLTAVGYGDPAFSGFYPSCRGVFGYHDPQQPAAGASVRYDVLGWYADPDDDVLQTFRARVAADLGRAPSAADLARAMEDRLHLGLDPGGAPGVAEPSGPADPTGAARVPDGLVLVGSVVVGAPVPGGGDLPRFPTVAVGPSATEATAAHLTGRLAAWTGTAPALVEEQLDYLNLGAAVDPRHVDLGFAYHDLCHEQSFGSVPSGTLWRLVPASEHGAPADAEAVAGRQHPTADLAVALEQLNALQREADEIRAALASLGAQLFADWQKWMLGRAALARSGAVADPDRIMDLIERHDLVEVTRSRERAARLERRIATATHRIETAIAGTGHALEPTAAPRFRIAAEPFILFEGPAVAETGRFGRPEPRTVQRCPVVSVAERDPRALRDLVAGLGERLPVAPEPRAASAGWHPVLFDWEVEYFPLVEHADAGPDGRGYRPDYLIHHYDDEGDDVDLRLRPDRATADAADVVTGRSLLTAGAKTQVIDSLERFVWQQLIVGNYWGTSDAPPESERSAYLADHLDEVLSRSMAWAAERGIPSDLMVAATSALALARRLDLMGQTLSGFNAALLMQRQVPQLPVADPLGFADQRDLSDRVRAAVGRGATHAVAPESAFHPLRAGDLSILRLRIVDRFGRHIDYERDAHRDPGRRVEVLVSRGLPRRDHAEPRFHLPARLAQPARIAADWLSAEHDHLEVSDHPTTSPICGWFVPNHLDRSLLVYGADGVLAGSIATGPDHLDRRHARWLPAPGDGGVAHPHALGNRHLRDAVANLRARGPEDLEERLAVLDATAAMIEPHAAADDPDLALLMGRPFALVRARIDLRVPGRPAIDQSWSALEAALRAGDGEPRPDRGFPQVAVRVRLGEFRRLDDGLLGYWVEGAHGIGAAGLHLAEVQTDDDGAPAGGRHGATVDLSVGGGPVTVAMLVDPRAPIHVSCGLLPTATLRVLPQHASAGLRRLAFTFFSAPILSPQGPVHVPMPHEDGYRWVWIERDGAAWNRLEDAGLVAAVPPTTDRRQVLHDGWLRLEPTGPEPTGPEPIGDPR